MTLNRSPGESPLLVASSALGNRRLPGTPYNRRISATTRGDNDHG